MGTGTRTTPRPLYRFEGSRPLLHYPLHRSNSKHRLNARTNVPVNVDAIMFYQAIDVEKVILNVERYLDATTLAAQTTLREVIGKVSFDELLAEREKVGVEA